MFKLDLSPSYYAPISIDMLDADGVLRTHVFDLRFKRLDADELKTLMADVEAKKLSEDEFMGRMVLGWRGVKDADGNDSPFTPDNVQALLKVAGMRAAVVAGWFASLAPTKSAEYAAKN